MASRPPAYFTDDAMQRLGREETIAGNLWRMGAGLLEADTGQRGGSTIDGLTRGGIRRTYNAQNEGWDAFSPGTADALNLFRTAPIFNLEGSTDAERGWVYAFPGQQARLMSGGEVISTASTPEEIQRLAALANQASAEAGRKGNFEIQTGAGDNWNTVWRNAPDKSGIGMLGDLALPAIGAALAPLTGGASLLATGLGAAGGSALSSALQGRDLGETLLRAGLTGATAAGVGALTQGLGGSVAGKAGTAASSGVPGAADIGVGQVPGLGGAPVVGGAFDPSMLTVTASKLGGLNLGLGPIGGSLAGIGGSLLSGVGGQVQVPRTDYQPQPGDDPLITATAGKTGGIPAAALAIPAVGGAAALSGISDAAQAAMESGQTASERVDPTDVGATSPTRPPLGIGDYANLGLGGLSVLQGIGGLLGIGGGNAGGNIAGFNPNPGLVAWQPLNRQQNPITFDPFTYGQTGGEFRFFTDATPQFQINQPAAGIGSLPAPTVMSQPAAYVPSPQNFARGGKVRGIGGGQDDLIDAKLSDGEYVFSAQDVSDLGDGSNEEGARRLDEMRQLIRRQAGRKNTKTIAPPQKGVRSILRAVK